MKLADRVRQTTVGRSVFRSPERVTERDRAAGHWANFLLHIYPVKVRRKEITFKYSAFLGVASLVLFVSLLVSGIYLMFFYLPSPANAYGNIQSIQTDVAFGQFIRNVHRWSAHLMVIAVAAHMARVFYRGAYKSPREFNWVIGAILLVLTLLLSFTGYLLPWDQLAYWAVTVGTAMAAWVPIIGDDVKELLLGGPTVGSATLLRFYVLHVAVLPAVLIGVVTLHLWRWRKDSMLTSDPAAVAGNGPGGVDVRPGLPIAVSTPAEPVVVEGKRILGVVPGKPAVGDRKEPSDEDLVMVWPHLLVRHAVAALVVILVVLVVSLAFDAPLREIANPGITPNPEKAPWYFAALQELLSHYHPLVAGILVPTAIVLGIMALPYMDRNPLLTARFRRIARVTFTIFMVVWIVLTLIGFAFRGPSWSWVWPWEEWHGEL
ncbi:MAG: cytochrome b N-terminal domain-containing protein [Acidimicrobiia bacterium]|nr:cytochrome b N-terminal domain-containing protein [Acidimicrobiia bacterium]